MSNLDLLNAGFAAIFGEGGLPSSNIHELCEATYIMKPLPSLGANIHCKGAGDVHSQQIKSNY